MAKYLITEQECFGKTQWRTMKMDGNKMIEGCHSIDFETFEDAQLCVHGEVRRNKLGPSEISIKRLRSSSVEIETVGNFVGPAQPLVAEVAPT